MLPHWQAHTPKCVHVVRMRGIVGAQCKLCTLRIASVGLLCFEARLITQGDTKQWYLCMPLTQLIGQQLQVFASVLQHFLGNQLEHWKVLAMNACIGDVLQLTPDLLLFCLIPYCTCIAAGCLSGAEFNVRHATDRIS